MTSRNAGSLVLLVTALAAAGAAQAAVLDSALRGGSNIFAKEASSQRHIPITGNPGQPSLMIGDSFTFILVEGGISNSTFSNTPLSLATSSSPYQLASIGSLLVTAIQPSVVGPMGTVDLQMMGTIDFYETTSASLIVNFTTDTFASSIAKVTAGSLLLSTATDFYQVMGVPPEIGMGVPDIIRDGGLTVTANPAGFNIVSGGTSFAHPEFSTGGPVNTSHDMSITSQNVTFSLPAPAPLLGDFDFDLDVDLKDYLTLSTNLHTNVSGMSTEQSYTLGDITRDQRIDGNDFCGFVFAYDAANGQGALAAALGAIPEPANGVLAAFALLVMLRRRPIG